MRNLAITFLFVGVAFSLLYFFVGVYKVVPISQLPQKTSHFYKNPSIPLTKIHIHVMYFVPRNKVKDSKSDWKNFVEPHLKELQAFHKKQFLGLSDIEYSFVDVPVVGEQDVSFYGDAVSDTSPQSIEEITKEISKRRFKEGGDIASLFTQQQNSYEVTLVIYEGEGGAGSNTYSVVSRDYLTNEIYAPYASTILAHEFYHSLGIPDNYTLSKYVFPDGETKDVSILSNKDIMGRINIPLMESYIDQTTLTLMGL